MSDQSSDKNEACTCNCGTLDGAKAYSNEDVSGLPPDLVVAMTVWGEARGESLEGKKAVASVICNRAMRKSHAGHLPFEVELSAVCLAPHQFSCWSDGEFVQQEPDYDSSAWLECHEVAKALFESTFRPCTNATHYFSDSINPPHWAAKMKFVEKIGHHSFYLESSWHG
jgi:N-acetylmuramoyl-L-alanine amidase